MSTEYDRRLEAVEAAQAQQEQTITRVLRVLEDNQGESQRAWRAIEACQEEDGRLGHRVKRLEEAFDTQWTMFRRLELAGLDNRKEMHNGFNEVRNEMADVHTEVGDVVREMRDGFASLGRQLAGLAAT